MMPPQSKKGSESGSQWSDSGDDNYGLSHRNCLDKHGHVFPELIETEPADPDDIDHNTRRQARIAPSTFDPSELPSPLVECGCGDCPDRYDALADEYEGAFDDVLSRSDMAADECDDPRPMTMRRASRAYFVYQSASLNDERRTSRLESLQNQHAQAMDQERELLQRWEGNVTTALLSLRLSPVEEVERDAIQDNSVETGEDTRGGESAVDNYGLCVRRSDSPSHSDEANRQWVPPLQVCNRLRDPWRNVYRRLAYHLSDFDWEYCWVVSTTDSAATPHFHLYCWIRDPEDEITVDHLRPAVETFVDNAPSAKEEHHPVSEGESDAATVQHNPSKLDISDDQALHIFHQRNENGFEMNTAGFAYLMNQRPDWALRRIHDGESDILEEGIALEGGAIAWASPNKWIDSSGGIDLKG